MAYIGPKMERDGGLSVKSSYVPIRQPVAQARKRLNLKPVLSEIDKPFLTLVMVLLVFGLVMMFSASYAWGLNDAGDGYYYIRKQMTAAGIGLFLMLLASVLDYHFFQNTKVAFIFFTASFLLTLYTSFFGKATADAKRWIVIGPLQLQPSEILKIALIVMFAYIMSVNFRKFYDWKYSVLPFVILLGLVAGVLVLQRHMSAVMLVGIIGLSMMFISGMPKKLFWRVIAVCAVFGGLYLVYKVAFGSGFGYIKDRIQSWLHPLSATGDETYQTYESLLAIGSGGWFGLGFGESRQKFLYLPEAQNDFIFSIVCEELGFIGAMVVVLLFFLFILRGIYIATHAKDRFGMLLAAGITIQIGSQAILNIMVACNAFPNTGISLPFFSYGGTALLIQLAEMGVLLSISRQCKDTNKEN